LRLLFAIIASVGSGAAMLLKDLEDPFQGSFCINLAAKQLTDFENLLKADIAEAEDEMKQVGLPAFISLDRERQRPNYHAGNTVYFHLLTGPLASSIRMIGDLLAWSCRRIMKSWAALKTGSWRKPRGSQRKAQG